MAPEQHGNTNLWDLFEGEYVTDGKTTIEGPATVRVHEYEGGIKVVQHSTDRVAFKAPSLDKVVKKK